MDSEIVRLHREGRREEALRLFAQAHQKQLHALARRLLRNDEEAYDALQEVFLQVDKSLPRFDGASSVYTWAFRIAVNVCLNMQRTLRSKATHLGLEEVMLPIDDEKDGPDTSCVRSFRAFVVEQALLRLPDSQRVAITLHDMEEMTAPEVAAILGIDANAVKARVRRGRAALRTLIAGEYRARGVDIEDVGAITCVSDFLADDGFRFPVAGFREGAARTGNRQPKTG